MHSYMVGTCTFVNYAAIIHPSSLCLCLQMLYLSSLQFAFEECKQFWKNCRFSLWFWKDGKMSIERHVCVCVEKVLCIVIIAYDGVLLIWAAFTCFFWKWLKYFAYRNFFLKKYNKDVTMFNCYQMNRKVFPFSSRGNTKRK